jgi:multidrug efflux pump subunit AcrB
MSLSDLSIKNPVFAVMLSAAMIVFGYLGYRDMGVSQFPEIDFPVVSIAVTREGASPDIIDGDVTDVVEDAVAGVEGIDYVMSQSLEGRSIVTVYFRLERNIDVAMQDVQNAVAAARRRLPLDIDPPVISKVNPNNLPVMWLTLSGPIPLYRISDFAEKEFKQLIAAIPEVGGVQFGGLQSRNIRIWVDAVKLAGYNLGVEEVAEALRRQHAELPAGYIQSSRVEFNLRTMGEAYSLKELEDLLIARRDGQPIYLREIGVVENGLEDRRSLARFNRMPAVAVGVRKAIGGNLVAVCENVKKELPNLVRRLPKEVQLHVPVDYSLFVRENVEELKFTLFLGILLTAVVCFLFLGSIGTTINICLSIPTSLMGTFFVVNYGMRLFGLPPFTINLMTLLALSLSVGVVVDDAILVLENIYRHREEGAARRHAALFGAREIAFAAVAATFSIIAIFLPVAFMTGIIGKFFFQFGVTVSVAVFLSLLCALTLTPMLCAFFLNVREKVAKRPTPFRWPLVLFLAGLTLVLGLVFRLSSLGFGGLLPWTTPLLDLLRSVLRGLPKLPSPPPIEQTAGLARWSWWGIETGLEVLIVVMVVRWGTTLYWMLNRFVLEPCLLRPTDWLMNGMTAGYARALGWSLRHWGVTLAASMLLVVGTGAMLWFNVLGRELVPSEDQSRFVVHLVGPVGSSIQQIDELLRSCEDILVQRPEVLGLLTTVATEPGQLMNEADIFVQLVPREHRRHSQQELMQILRAELDAVTDARIIMRDLSTEGFTAQRGAPVDFAIQGDWEKLPGYARKIMHEMEQSGWVVDVDSDYRAGMSEIRIVPDRDKLASLGVPVERLADSMSLMIGGQRVAKFTDQGRRYDVRLRLQVQQRATPGQLDPLMIRAGERLLVPVGELAERQIVATLPVINRYQHTRKIEITANPAEGKSQGEAIAACRAIAERILPEDYRIVDLGNAQAMQQTIASLLFALVLGIVIAYMILGVQFNSFIHPLTVLLAMPFAVTGAFVTLWATGDTLNMMSLIGLILLMGLVKKNSIILVDYTNTVRSAADASKDPDLEGNVEAAPKPLRLTATDAVLQACPIRLRPIMMTSIATVAGAIPAALGLGPGAETRAPMARAIIGGIMLSTLVTLFLVPVFYVLVERLAGVAGRLVVRPR